MKGRIKSVVFFFNSHDTNTYHNDTFVIHFFTGAFFYRSLSVIAAIFPCRLQFGKTNNNVTYLEVIWCIEMLPTCVPKVVGTSRTRGDKSPHPLELTVDRSANGRAVPTPRSQSDERSPLVILPVDDRHV